MGRSPARPVVSPHRRAVFFRPWRGHPRTVNPARVPVLTGFHFNHFAQNSIAALRSAAVTLCPTPAFTRTTKRSFAPAFA